MKSSETKRANILVRRLATAAGGLFLLGLCSWLIQPFSSASTTTLTSLQEEGQDEKKDDGILADPEVMRERGAQIYKAQCADCHGAKGEGDDYGYSEPLIGDSTVGELTKVIADTMPEGEPGLCSGPDAEAVAAYIHFEFYSEAARLRNRPPTLALSRLTANQLRQSLADLYAHFDGITGVKNEFGVQAEYYSGTKRPKDGERLDRVDPVIDFDFGKEAPAEGITPEEFTINWRGGLLATETGSYEIIVRSSCSFVMDFGRNGRELINNHVQSGDKTEFRERLELTAGRVYPFSIRFRQRKRSTELPPAWVSLSWVPPKGTEEIIPTQHLVPGWFPATYSVEAELPPDDRSYGFERGISVSRQWDDSTTNAAFEFAEIVISELWPRYQNKHKNDPNENRAQLRSFLSELGKVAFRGRFDEATQAVYVDRQLEAAEDDGDAIRRSVLAILKSPRFLYPSADVNASASQQAANRLALTLFDSLPSDNWLLDQVNKGNLQDENQIRQAAKRMVADYRSQAKIREMLQAWLNLSHVGEIAKDSEKYPGFDEELVTDLRDSLNAFLDEVVWGESGDYRQLFLADWAYTTPKIAEYYGEEWRPTEASSVGMSRTSANPEIRRGVLTHPYLMSGLAYNDASSPIHRGVFLIRYMMGRTIRPPNAAFTPLSPDLHPNLTTRQRVELQTGSDGCQVCHGKINKLGFTLENFDADGRFRANEKEKPIDATGEYTTRSDEQVAFNGPQELAEFLANSEDAQRAFVNRAFQHLVKQPIAAYGSDTLDELTEKFKNSGFRIRDLAVEIAVIAAMEEVGKADSASTGNPANTVEPSSTTANEETE